MNELGRKRLQNDLNAELDLMQASYYQRFKQYGVTPNIVEKRFKAFREEAAIIYVVMDDRSENDDDGAIMHEVFVNHITARMNGYILNEHLMPERTGR